MLMCKCYDGNFTDLIHESYLPNRPDSLKQINRSQLHRVYLSEEPDRTSEYRERKPKGKGLLTRVKCQQRNTPKPRESVSLQKSCYVAGSITSQYFPDFLNLSESCREKAVFVQRHNTALHLKFRQTNNIDFKTHLNEKT